MATMKYFNGETEIFHPYGMKNAEFAARFPGVTGIRYDSFTRMVAVPAGARWSEAIPVERRISYKSNPSKHVCDARCMGAKPNGNCECSCGGKNHGRGFICEAA